MKTTPATIAITIASLIGAGLIGSIHADGLDDFQRPTRLGRAVHLNGDQTIVPIELSIGQFAVSPRSSSSVISPARIVSVRLQLATPTRRQAVGARCFVRSADGSVSEELEDDGVLFPPPGFRQTATVLVEVARDKLPGAALVCTESNVIVFRESEMVLPLGVDRGNLDQVWRDTQHQRVAWSLPALEVLP